MHDNATYVDFKTCVSTSEGTPRHKHKHKCKHTHTHTHNTHSGALTSSFIIWQDQIEPRLQRASLMGWRASVRLSGSPPPPSGPYLKPLWLEAQTHFIVPRDPTHSRQADKRGRSLMSGPSWHQPVAPVDFCPKKHSLDPLRPSGQDYGSGTGFDKATRTRS